MAQKETLKPLVTKSKVPSYQRKDTSILPLPTFITRETPEQVERPVDKEAGSSRRNFEDWERDTNGNMNKMAVNE